LFLAGLESMDLYVPEKIVHEESDYQLRVGQMHTAVEKSCSVEMIQSTEKPKDNSKN
jgi:hypothetical protein